MLALSTAVPIILVGGVTSASAATPEAHERGSAAGQADSPRGTAPLPSAVRAPAATASPHALPDGWTAQALADKAKADSGFRSPNQKPNATGLNVPMGPKAPQGTVAPAQTQSLATTFQAVTDTQQAPPDTIMAAGPSNIVVAVNTEVAVYTKVGTQVSVQQLSDLFKLEGAPAQDFIADPYVVYDPYASRFWLVALSVHDNPNRSNLLLALSNSSDATSGWSTFHVDASLNGNDHTDNWCDRDTIGFDTQAIYLTCDMFSFPTTKPDFKDTKIRVMTKGQLLTGTCCKWWDFFNLGEGFLGLSTPRGIRPAQMLGATDADGEYLVDAHGGGGSDDTLEVWHITNANRCCTDNPSAPDLAQNGRPVGSYDPAPDVRQQGTSATLDPGTTVLQYAFWQGGHLSTGQNLACPSVHAACVAYTEVNVGNYPDMSVVNDFVLPASDTLDRFYPAAAPNGNGDKAMVFSASGPNRFAGTSFVLIPNSSTCTNCFNTETSIADGLGPYGTSGKQRWGDYSGASADPDGDGVWVYGEFANTGNQWGTEVGLTMDRTPTSITYTGPLGADSNATVQLSANLVQAAPGGPTPLAGAIVTIFVGTQVCNATTDAAGRAVCSVKLDQPDGTVDLQAEFPGDIERTGASTTQQFVIGAAGRAAVTLTYTGDTSGEFQATANLAATLIDPASGSGVVGDPITFTLGAQSCTGTTDLAGLARCAIVLQQRPGNYTVTATFPGDPIFAAATVSAPFTINKGRTVTTLMSSKNPSDFGQDVTFTATVTAANPGAVAPSGQVTFKRSTITLGTRSLDAVGHSALTAPILQVGQNMITAGYGGNDFFLGSSAALTQTVQCSTTLTGDQPGGLTLSAGSTCLNNATVNGRITIGAGAAVSITNSRLNGGITATDGLALTVCGSRVDGDINVTSSAKYVLVGDAGDDGTPACAGNTLKGTTTIFASQGQAEVGGNTITDDLIIDESSGTGPDEESTQTEIEANKIGGSLFCLGNTPPPTNDGQPNTITGQGFDQCAGF